MIIRHHRNGTCVHWWLAAAFALLILGGCEHGNLSFDDSTGLFTLPTGAGSHELVASP